MESNSNYLKKLMEGKSSRLLLVIVKGVYLNFDDKSFLNDFRIFKLYFYKNLCMTSLVCSQRLYDLQCLNNQIKISFFIKITTAFLADLSMLFLQHIVSFPCCAAFLLFDRIAQSLYFVLKPPPPSFKKNIFPI
jgi:hypothetical protein